MSMGDVDLGRIEWLDIREVWKHEALGFTPWLLGNANELGQALGIELELEEAEHAVGRFSLDLIGRDLTHDARLIVENQIEQSDHGHLGQLLTYAAGTDAATIVWVARSFREEHRVALDWLNTSTGEDLRFFAAVVKAIKIDGSRPAPFFEIVARPNDWQKAVKAATSGQQTVEAAAYRRFWEPVRDSIEEDRSDLLTGREIPRSFAMTINSPIPRSRIQGQIGVNELRVMLEIDTGSRDANVEILAGLEALRQPLEARLGELDFDESGQRSRVLRRRPWAGRLLDQPDRHDEAREWFREGLLEFRAAFEAVADSLPPGRAG